MKTVTKKVDCGTSNFSSVFLRTVIIKEELGVNLWNPDERTQFINDVLEQFEIIL